MGVPLTRADQGAWFVGALLDDVALNTPCGAAQAAGRGNRWVASMYGNVDAGERFFDLAEDLLRYPGTRPAIAGAGLSRCLSLVFAASTASAAQPARPRSPACAPRWRG